MNTTFPKTIKIAGWAWVAMAVLCVLGIISVAMLLPLRDLTVAALTLGVIGLIFLYMGFRTIRGKARDTLGSAIFSLLGAFGGLYYGDVSLTSELETVGFFLPIILLALAGILALVGRRRYRVWRTSHTPNEL